jgi:uncharacterized protein YbbK (DUF523 family)
MAPVLVSSCLAGLCTNWRCAADRFAAVAEAVRRGEAIAVCPEQLGGLPTPRVPAERQGDRVVSATGRDLTDPYRLGAERALEIARAHGCETAVLKSLSPSCGVGEIRDGSFSRRNSARDGVAAELLRAAGLRIVTECEVDSVLG